MANEEVQKDKATIKEAIKRHKKEVYTPVVPEQQFGFIHNNVDCIGCRACEIACKDKRPAPPRFRRVMYVEGGTYPAVYAYKINMSCNHCAEPACLPVCPTGAIFTSARKMASSTLIPACALVAAVAKPLARLVHRNSSPNRTSFPSAICAWMKSTPGANRIA